MRLALPLLCSYDGGINNITMYKEFDLKVGQIYKRGDYIDVFSVFNANLVKDGDKKDIYLAITNQITPFYGYLDNSNYQYVDGSKLFSGNIYNISKDCFIGEGEYINIYNNKLSKYPYEYSGFYYKIINESYVDVAEKNYQGHTRIFCWKIEVKEN